VLDTAVRTAAFDDLARQLSGLVNRFKRAATAIVRWIVTHALELVPKSLRDFVEGTVKERLADLVQRPGHLAAKVSPFFVAPRRCRTGGRRSRPMSGRTSIRHRSSVHPPHRLDHDRTEEQSSAGAGVVVLDVARTVPHVQLAYYIAVATAVVFVVAQEWEGIRRWALLL